MYNPEWEAIKDFDYTPKFVDVQFELNSGEIPADHAWPLYAGLLEHLHWLAEEPGVGVHPVHGSPTGRNDNILLNRRVKLVLRVPVGRQNAVLELAGKVVTFASGDMQIGAAKLKPIMPNSTLYAPVVDYGYEDEARFLEAARVELDGMEIRCGMIPGKQRKMRLPDGECSGYSLMLHDVSLVQSLRIQEEGLGRHRGFGCGIFVPHKSIKEVVID